MPPAQDEQELAAIEGEDGADSGTVLTASEEDAEAREEVSPEAALGETDEDEGASVTEVEVSGATDPDTDEAGQSADDAVSDELGELAIDDGVTERTEIIFVDSVAKDVVEHLSWHPGELHVLDADRAIYALVEATLQAAADRAVELAEEARRAKAAAQS